MNASAPPPDNDGGVLTQLHIAMIRLDAKVDGLYGRIAEIGKTHDDHEGRIRSLESQKVDPARIKALEDKPSVSPATVWKVIGALISVLGILTTVILSVTR